VVSGPIRSAADRPEAIASTWWDPLRQDHSFPGRLSGRILVGDIDEGGLMDPITEPGAEGVSPATRAFEVRDALVVAGADRPPTPDEEAAAERWGPLKEATREAFREMLARGAWQRGEGRAGW
jgi:hypothetical protein